MELKKGMKVCISVRSLYEGLNGGNDYKKYRKTKINTSFGYIICQRKENDYSFSFYDNLNHFRCCEDSGICDIDMAEDNTVRLYNVSMRCPFLLSRKEAEYAIMQPAENTENADKDYQLSYKDFPKETIGYSDIATLLLAGCKEASGFEVEKLEFGEDGEYQAYIINGNNVAIGEHYKKITEFTDYIKIYDDDGLVRIYMADRIVVYRAGMRGCIIQLMRHSD